MHILYFNKFNDKLVNADFIEVPGENPHEMTSNVGNWGSLYPGNLLKFCLFLNHTHLNEYQEMLNIFLKK